MPFFGLIEGYFEILIEVYSNTWLWTQRILTLGAGSHQFFGKQFRVFMGDYWTRTLLTGVDLNWIIVWFIFYPVYLFGWERERGTYNNRNRVIAYSLIILYNTHSLKSHQPTIRVAIDNLCTHILSYKINVVNQSKYTTKRKSK